MPWVYVHRANPSHPPERSQAHCTLHIRARQQSTWLIGRSFLHIDINIQEEKRREKKNLSLPKRHGRQGRWACHLARSVLSLSFASVLTLLMKVPGVFGSSFKRFNHRLPQPGFNKHRCVLSIFVCSTTLGNRPTHSLKRRGEKTDTLTNMLLSFVCFKVVLKVSSLTLTGAKDSLFLWLSPLPPDAWQGCLSWVPQSLFLSPCPEVLHTIARLASPPAAL